MNEQATRRSWEIRQFNVAISAAASSNCGISAGDGPRSSGKQPSGRKNAWPLPEQGVKALLYSYGFPYKHQDWNY
jgi:hypothetical protein